MSHAKALILALAALTVATGARAEETISIEQKGRMFDKTAIAIHVGDTVAFLNHDDFDHQIYVKSPSFTFESDEVPPGSTVRVRFTKPGHFEVHCHIHPKMGLIVDVQ